MYKLFRTASPFVSKLGASPKTLTITLDRRSLQAHQRSAGLVSKFRRLETAKLSICAPSVFNGGSGNNQRHRCTGENRHSRVFHQFLLRIRSIICFRPLFSPSEFEGRQSVALISYNLWQRRFGGESDAVGKSIRIDEGNATVIGILPPSFTFPSATTDLWQPLSAERNWTEVRADGSGL